MIIKISIPLKGKNSNENISHNHNHNIINSAQQRIFWSNSPKRDINSNNFTSNEFNNANTNDNISQLEKLTQNFKRVV